jgi:hypothetical protein
VESGGIRDVASLQFGKTDYSAASREPSAVWLPQGRSLTALGWRNSLDTKVNTFVFNKLPVTVTVTVRYGSAAEPYRYWKLPSIWHCPVVSRVQLGVPSPLPGQLRGVLAESLANKTLLYVAHAYTHTHVWEAKCQPSSSDIEVGVRIYAYIHVTGMSVCN